MVLRIGVIVCFSVLAVGFWILQVVQHKFYRSGPTTTTCARFRCARRAACCSTATAASSSRIATRSRSRSSASGLTNLEAVAGVLADARPASTSRRFARSCSGIGARRRSGRFRSSSTRRSRRSSPCGRGSSSCRASSCSSADARVSGGRPGGAPVRLRRRDSGGAARAAGVRRARGRRDRRADRRRAHLQRAASWASTAAATSSSTASAAKSTSSATRPPTEGKRLQLTIDYDLQRALEDAFHKTRLRRRGGVPRSAHRRDSRDDEPAGLRPERLRGRHREREVGRAQQGSAEAAREPADSGHATRPDRRSRS